MIPITNFLFTSLAVPLLESLFNFSWSHLVLSNTLLPFSTQGVITERVWHAIWMMCCFRHCELRKPGCVLALHAQGTSHWKLALCQQALGILPVQAMQAISFCSVIEQQLANAYASQRRRRTLLRSIHVHSYRYSHGISILLGLGTPLIVPLLCAISPLSSQGAKTRTHSMAISDAIAKFCNNYVRSR